MTAPDMLRPAPTVFQSRGVFHFEGRVRCPLDGVGQRGAYESNRLVLDDADTEVTIDRARGRITVRNERRYERATPICDLQFLALGTTEHGTTTPFGIHLKILKAGDRITLDLHRHLRVPEPLVAAEYEPFEVIVTDGARSTVVFDRARGDALVTRPSLALRIVKSLMTMRDNLARARGDARMASSRVADLSLGFGAFGLEWMLARARLESMSPDNDEWIARGSVVEMLRNGVWELSIDALSDRWLPEVVQRDLFLFGLDDVPLLEGVRARGLRKGQTLSFRIDRGRGAIGLDGRFEPLPHALDVARAYLEFHMLGGLLCESAESHARRAR